MRRASLGLSLLLVSSALASACGADPGDAESGDELAVGSIEGESNDFGAALKCKAIPVVPVLTDPAIVVSLSGLTLHLWDRKGTYDRVFPIGPGAIENGASLTPIGSFTTGPTATEVTDAQWGYNYPCRIWHTDESGKKLPVFAGLPFIRLVGPPSTGYGIHGPIDAYTLPSGGSLRRGYVSHGCTRMAAADIVEVYGRIRGRTKVPVKIQQEVERRADGTAVDVATKWIGAECRTTADCNFTGGVCRVPPGATRGFCTAPCTKTCTDRQGEVPTFCVDDPSVTDASVGMCVPQASTTWNRTCARYENGLRFVASEPRPDKSASAAVCE
jgi:hypothetical protein